MEGEDSIRTQFDDLLSNLKSAAGKPLSVQSLSSACGMPEKAVLDWLHVLEKNGQVHIENRFSGIYASWVGTEKSRPMVPKSLDAAMQVRIESAGSFDSQISRAHEVEEKAKASHAPSEQKADYESEPEALQEGGTAPASEGGSETTLETGSIDDEDVSPVQRMPLRKEHKIILESMDAELATVGKQIEQVESMIAKLSEAKKQAAATAKKAAREKADEEKQAQEESKPKLPAQKTGKSRPEAPKKSPPSVQEDEKIEEEAETILEENKKAEERSAKEPQKPYPLEITPIEEKQPSQSLISRLTEFSKKKSKHEKIKRPQPVQVTGVSLQFSDRLARQVKKIISQTQEIESLRMEKEKLLTEHYNPMQRKLESEIETISDRVLRMEKNILGMQQRASELPSKVTGVEKLQLSSIKAHAEMRRAYDEASALIEESNRLLADEREKMEIIAEQSRLEISAHKSKTVELEQTLSQISHMEQEASNRVISARATLAEQAERLAEAETHAKELASLKEEISEGVAELKREISSTKGVLTGLEKQISQLRQIEIWADSISQDYGQKMSELGDYVRNGNEEFDTLRESVEANFVRRYLRELRQLTDSYTFEFNQVRQVEGDIDKRVEEEKKKLEALLEEGRKISYLYELQSKEPEGAGKFEERGAALRNLPELSAQRTQIEQMIAQVVGKKSEYQPNKSAKATVSAPKVAGKKAKEAKKAGKIKKGKKR